MADKTAWFWMLISLCLVTGMFSFLMGWYGYAREIEACGWALLTAMFAKEIPYCYNRWSEA